MLAHDFQEMPGRSVEIGDNFNETVLLLRCVWCMRTPKKAREDGCPVRELQEAGHILLSEWNPEGVEHFEGRTCVTCDTPIMGHWLRKGRREYWCHENQNQFSYGINNCTYDVEGITIPKESNYAKGL